MDPSERSIIESWDSAHNIQVTAVEHRLRGLVLGMRLNMSERRGMCFGDSSSRRWY